MTRPIGISVPHRRVEDDDDIQEYKRPWVGLTDEEVENLCLSLGAEPIEVRFIEAKLKEKNA